MTNLTKSFLIILTVTLAVVFAEATPALGDRSIFAVTLSKGSQSLNGKVTYELTAHDKSTGSWTQTITTDFSGQKQTQTETVKSSDLLDDATIDYVLANCAARGGMPENISVPAGSFNTCSIPVKNKDGSGTYWIAKVPFGFAKWTNLRNDGVMIVGLLESFIHGSGE